jgi:hypothetical protein
LGVFQRRGLFRADVGDDLGILLVIVGIPTLLWLTWRRNARHGRDNNAETFSTWTVDAFHTCNGDLSGKEAALQILLPIAAVSIGMTIFGLVYYLDVPHAGY